MESNLIVGALIAITSGVIVQIVNSFIDIKKEKRKFVFEKIEDIINSISAINEGLQQDAATTFGPKLSDSSFHLPQSQRLFQNFPFLCGIKPIGV